MLKGGHVIDPKNGVDAVRDVAIQAARSPPSAPSIDASRARKTIDVSGLYVTPGLVDIHTHLFHTTGIRDAWAGDDSVQPDAFSFRTGVTTMVDAGSSGWRNFDTFRFTVIDRVKTRVLAMINIAGLGMMADVTEQVSIGFQAERSGGGGGEESGRGGGSEDGALSASQLVVGRQAVEAGKLAASARNGGLRLLSCRSGLTGSWSRSILRPGDISTHMFRGPVPYVDEHGKLYDYLKQARERGVKFDVGHGGQSFVLRNAAPAIAQGFWPDTISSDLHTHSMNAQMMDMPTLISKFLALGMPLKERYPAHRPGTRRR